MADVAGRDIGSYVEEAKKAVRDNFRPPDLGEIRLSRV
jgi:Cu/Ag efflux pump CusA